MGSLAGRVIAAADPALCQHARLSHAARATPRQPEALPGQLLAIIASAPVPKRAGRSEPRAKKRPAKNCHLLTKPRSAMKVPPHRNRPRPVSQKCH